MLLLLLTYVDMQKEDSGCGYIQCKYPLDRKMHVDVICNCIVYALYFVQEPWVKA